MHPPPEQGEVLETAQMRGDAIVNGKSMLAVRSGSEFGSVTYMFMCVRACVDSTLDRIVSQVVTDLWTGGV